MDSRAPRINSSRILRRSGCGSGSVSFVPGLRKCVGRRQLSVSSPLAGTAVPQRPNFWAERGVMPPLFTLCSGAKNLKAGDGGLLLCLASVPLYVSAVHQRSQHRGLQHIAEGAAPPRCLSCTCRGAGCAWRNDDSPRRSCSCPKWDPCCQRMELRSDREG